MDMQRDDIFILTALSRANIELVYFQGFPSLELVNPQQVFSISPYGMFYFPRHRHFPVWDVLLSPT